MTKNDWPPCTSSRESEKMSGRPNQHRRDRARERKEEQRDTRESDESVKLTTPQWREALLDIGWTADKDPFLKTNTWREEEPPSTGSAHGASWSPSGGCDGVGGGVQ